MRNTEFCSITCAHCVVVEDGGVGCGLEVEARGFWPFARVTEDGAMPLVELLATKRPCAFPGQKTEIDGAAAAVLMDLYADARANP